MNLFLIIKIIFSFLLKKKMTSRLNAGESYNTLVTTQKFTDAYLEIIREKNKSFYQDTSAFSSNFQYVIRHYTGEGGQYSYKELNRLLNSLQKIGDLKMRSFVWTLHSALSYRKSNVVPGTVVYRGCRNVSLGNIKVGSVFYLPSFVSTSQDPKIASSSTFLQGSGILFIITLTQGGTVPYCRDVTSDSQYDEKEILITAFCRYKLTGIEQKGKITHVKMDCLGY